MWKNVYAYSNKAHLKYKYSMEKAICICLDYKTFPLYIFFFYLQKQLKEHDDVNLR